MRRALTRTVLVLPVVALLLSACSDRSPVRPIQSTRPELNVVNAPAFVLLKKYGPAGATFTFDLTIGTGLFPAGDPVAITIGAFGQSSWIKIWEANNALAAPAGLVITEILPPGMQISHAWITPFARNAGGTFTEENNYMILPSGNSITVANMSFNRGAYVSIYNTEVPDGGGEGCTPGYWRQEQHYDSWVGYSPTQLFDDVFDNAFPGKTLGEVVALGGGGLNALGRGTVAALLNAASPDVDYEFTTAQVIAKFNAAFASGIYGPLYDEFTLENERGCPIN